MKCIEKKINWIVTELTYKWSYDRYYFARIVSHCDENHLKICDKMFSNEIRKLNYETYSLVLKKHRLLNILSFGKLEKEIKKLLNKVLLDMSDEFYEYTHKYIK